MIDPDTIAAHRFTSIDSTSAEAARLYENGAPLPIVVLAGEQLKGRGRRGRYWVSKPGNLYSTFAFPEISDRGDVAGYVFASTLAVRDAVSSLLPDDRRSQIRIKWPNDVEYDGHKLSGILLERYQRHNREPAIFIGCGINCAHAPDLSDRAVTSLAALNGNADVEICFAALKQALAHWLSVYASDGLAPLRQAWLASARGLGEPIRVALATETLDGVFEGLDESGQLMVRLSPHDLRTISAGDIFFPDAA
ncbi:MAG: biotin--[acetyl-CoA-carboxylase] ligase [Pseudomonadota bacterium]